MKRKYDIKYAIMHHQLFQICIMLPFYFVLVFFAFPQVLSVSALKIKFFFLFFFY